ncbi:MAG: flagellar FliJ family protein [Magnetospirillum sp.]|nr:flagellar FliJ family protein [Magnetospirillum sp.]
MARGLKTLIRLARWAVDEKRRVLTALQTREDEIVGAIADAERQLAAEQEVAARDATGAGYLYGAFAESWLSRRAELEAALAGVRAEIDVARDVLAEAYRQQKTYEITQANRDRLAREEADRKEQAFLDEVGLTTFRRRESGD